MGLDFRQSLVAIALAQPLVLAFLLEREHPLAPLVLSGWPLVFLSRSSAALARARIAPASICRDLLLFRELMHFGCRIGWRRVTHHMSRLSPK